MPNSHPSTKTCRDFWYAFVSYRKPRHHLSSERALICIVHDAPLHWKLGRGRFFVTFAVRVSTQLAPTLSDIIPAPVINCRMTLALKSLPARPSKSQFSYRRAKRTSAACRSPELERMDSPVSTTAWAMSSSSISHQRWRRSPPFIFFSGFSL